MKARIATTIAIASVSTLVAFGGVAYAFEAPNAAFAAEMVAPFAQVEVVPAVLQDDANKADDIAKLIEAGTDEGADLEAAESGTIAEPETTTPSASSAQAYAAEPATQTAATATDDDNDYVPANMTPRSIDVNGATMGYIDYFGAASAPATGAGLWMGSDSTTDGTWGYFIGHNPGSFANVMALGYGQPVTICDTDGNVRTYHVIDAFIVPDTTYWEDIESRVTGYGESIIVQTCCGDNANYRVVVCQ